MRLSPLSTTHAQSEYSLTLCVDWWWAKWLSGECELWHIESGTSLKIGLHETKERDGMKAYGFLGTLLLLQLRGPVMWVKA